MAGAALSAVAGLQGAGGQRVDVAAPGRRGHVHRHRTGAVLPPGIVPPVKVTVDPPAVAVTAPPQVVLAFGVAAIITPVGKVSTSGAVRSRQWR